MSMSATSDAAASTLKPRAVGDAWPYPKRSFLKLPVTVDVPRLVEEYRSIPADAWSSTHWGAHFSSNMLLLRGGSSGTPEDFTTRQVADQPCLKQLPYIRSL